MAHGLSKSWLQAFRQCPKRLWLAVHRPDVRDIPADTPLTSRQTRVARVIQSGTVERDPAAAVLLKRLTYPRYYLDFESMQVAVPLWAGTRPYQQLVVRCNGPVTSKPPSANWRTMPFWPRAGTTRAAPSPRPCAGHGGRCRAGVRLQPELRGRTAPGTRPDLSRPCAGPYRPDRAGGRSQAPDRTGTTATPR